MEYSKEEIEEAQAHLDRYTFRSKFWDTEDGQETMRIAREYGLKSQTTNEARSRVHAEMMAMERQGWKS